MPHYRYRATDATGTVVKATADSRNERELRDALLLQNLDVTQHQGAAPAQRHRDRQEAHPADGDHAVLAADGDLRARRASRSPKAST